MMKKLFLIGLIFMFTTTTTLTYGGLSTNKQAKTKFGLKIGTTGFDFLDSKDNASSKKFALGFHLDIFGEYKFINELGTQLTVFLTRKGNKSEVSSNEEIELNYLVSLVSLRYYPGKDRQFCLLMGPYLGYLLSGEHKFYVYGLSDEPKEMFKYDYKNQPQVRHVDYGVIVGLDYEFNVGLSLGITYHIGLRSVKKDTQSKNFGAQLDLGYNFGKLIQ